MAPAMAIDPAPQSDPAPAVPTEEAVSGASETPEPSQLPDPAATESHDPADVPVSHDPSPSCRVSRTEPEAVEVPPPEAEDPFALYQPAIAEEWHSDEEDVFGHGFGFE